MCYDQEKTQAPFDPRSEARIAKEARLKDADAYETGGGQCSRPMTFLEKIAALFSYQPPTPRTLPKFQAINQAAKNFAEVIAQNCPDGGDRYIAIQKIREARMLANAAISLDGLTL
jgi:hypothetical protein